MPVVTPVIVVAMPRTVTADLARAVIGPDDPAVAVRGVVIGRRVVGVPVKEVLPVEVRSVAIAPRVNPVEATIAAVEDRRSMIAATVKCDTAAMAAAASPMEATASMETSTAMEAAASVETAAPVPTTATAAMPNHGRHSAGYGFHSRGRAWACQRQRVGALLRCRREHKYRGSGNTETAQQTASKIRTLHPSTLPVTGNDEPQAALQRVRRRTDLPSCSV